MNKNKKVIFLHNIISPYRLPIFDGLAKETNLTVYFCKKTDDNRLWNTNTQNYEFRYTILPNFNIGPFVINYTIPLQVLRDDPDFIIISENPENALSILLLILYSFIFHKKVILLTERIDNEVLTLINLKKSSKKILRVFYFLISYIYVWYRKFLYFNSKAIITFSDKAKKNLLTEGVKNAKIYNLPQIMPEMLLLMPKAMKIDERFEGKTIIFTLCYLTERKGIDNLIKSFDSIKDDNSVLLIGGTGDYEDALKSLAKHNERIIFLGYLNDQQKANYYSIADFFVFPTLYDVWGFVVNEALYYDLPVISTSNAGAIEIIEEDSTGYIVEPNNIDELKSKIEYLLKNPQKVKELKTNVIRMNKSRITDTNEVVKGIASIIKKLT